MSDQRTCLGNTYIANMSSRYNTPFTLHIETICDMAIECRGLVRWVHYIDIQVLFFPDSERSFLNILKGGSVRNIVQRYTIIHSHRITAPPSVLVIISGTGDHSQTRQATIKGKNQCQLTSMHHPRHQWMCHTDIETWRNMEGHG